MVSIRLWDIINVLWILLNIFIYSYQILFNIVQCCVLKFLHAFFMGFLRISQGCFKKYFQVPWCLFKGDHIHLKHISMLFTYFKKVILMVLWISEHCFQICYICYLLSVTFYLILIGTCYLILPIWYCLSEACYGF